MIIQMFKQLTIKCLKLLCTVVGAVVQAHTPACGGGGGVYIIHCCSSIKCALFDVKLSWLLNFTRCGCEQGKLL